MMPPWIGKARDETGDQLTTGSAKRLVLLVGVAGFEPAAPASRRQCSTMLSYTPPASEGGYIEAGPSGQAGFGLLPKPGQQHIVRPHWLLSGPYWDVAQ